MAHAACSSRLRVNVSWAVGSCSVVVCTVRVLQHIHANGIERKTTKYHDTKLSILAKITMKQSIPHIKSSRQVVIKSSTID